jgi:hypothetical protein
MGDARFPPSSYDGYEMIDKNLGMRQGLTAILRPRHVDSDRASPIEGPQKIVCEAEYIYLLN